VTASSAKRGTEDPPRLWALLEVRSRDGVAHQDCLLLPRGCNRRVWWALLEAECGVSRTRGLGLGGGLGLVGSGLGGGGLAPGGGAAAARVAQVRL